MLLIMLIIMLLIMLLLTLLIMILLMLLIMLLLMLLIVLVREFESRRGEISNILSKKKRKEKKGSQLLRAPSVGKHNSTRVDEGSKS